MTRKRQKQIKKKYKPSDISSNDDAEDIRKYFIDRTIETIEFMSSKVFSGRVRDKDSENIRINQMKVIINACNVGNRLLKDMEYDIILKEVKGLKSAILFDNNGEEVIEIAPDKFDAIEDLDSKIAKLEENEWSE